jgi:hypothetical protein
VTDLTDKTRSAYVDPGDLADETRPEPGDFATEAEYRSALNRWRNEGGAR